MSIEEHIELAKKFDKVVLFDRRDIEAQASKIKKTGGVEQIKKVEAELARLGRIGGIESIFPTEGIVFKYKGKIYKLTGTFAAINQLLGLIKYGR